MRCSLKHSMFRMDTCTLQLLKQGLKKLGICGCTKVLINGEILALHRIDPTLSAQLYPSVVRYIVVQGDIIRMVQHLALQKIRIREEAFIVLRVTESGHIVMSYFSCISIMR
mgnify:CR=1 FL=1